VFIATAPATEAARPLTADGQAATLLPDSCYPLAAPLGTGVDSMADLPSGTVTFLLTDVEGVPNADVRQPRLTWRH
jgi:hypothetical protein